MGLRLPAALSAAVLERRAGHAGLHGRNDFPRPGAGTGDRAWADGANQPGRSVDCAAESLVDFREVLAVPAAMDIDRVRRGVSLHAITGADRLGLLCVAGTSGRANSR